MALKKRGRTWHTDFVVNGQRFRQSLGTRDWREAEAKEKELIAQASQATSLAFLLAVVSVICSAVLHCSIPRGRTSSKYFPKHYAPQAADTLQNCDTKSRSESATAAERLRENPTAENCQNSIVVRGVRDRRELLAAFRLVYRVYVEEQKLVPRYRFATFPQWLVIQ